MTEPEIDYTAVFRALPGMVALLTLQLVYADVNEEFVRLTHRTREQVVGHYLPDDAPGEPDDINAAAIRNVEASLRRVAETGERETMPLQRGYVEDPGRPGVRDERYVSFINAPVFGPDGRVALLLHRAEDVTELIRAREVALSLQEAMLPARPGATGPRCVTGPRPVRCTWAATSMTWSICPATGSRSPSVTWSATACPRPGSWDSCAAR